MSGRRGLRLALPMAGLLGASAAGALEDPTLVRLNGTTALTQTLLPAVAAREKLGEASIDRRKIEDGEFTVLGVGATWRTYVTDVSLKVPFEADSIRASLKAAAPNKGEIDTTYRFKDGRLRFTFHVATTPKTPLDGLVPEVVKRQTSIKDAFDVTINGFDGALDLTLKRSGAFVTVESVDRFTAHLGAVSVTDSARLVELAQAIVNLDRLFNVTGVSSVSQAATKLANALLEEVDLRKEIRNALREALKRASQMEFAPQPIPVATGASLAVSGDLVGLHTSADRAVIQWSADVRGTPRGAVPGLAYTSLGRPPQDIGQLTPQGDLEVFVPYALLDRVMYELVQMGLLRKITVPRSTAGALSVGFDLKVEPTEVPRVRPLPDTPGVLIVDFAARLADTDVGSVRAEAPVPRGAGPVLERQPTPSLTVPVRLTDGRGRAGIAFRLRGTPGGRLYLQYVGVTLDQLSGTLNAAGTTLPLSQVKTPLQNAIDAYLRQTVGAVTVIDQAVQVLPGVSIGTGEPRVGARYVGVPLTLRGH